MMPNQYIKITVLVATYNAAHCLQRCIDSVANQTYSNVELIILDGGSTDGTVDIIKANEKVIGYWESKPDKGIAHAWNKALRNMSGDWFIILGADDYLHDAHVLETFVQRLCEAGNSLVVYGEVNRVNEHGKVIEANDGGPWSLKRFLERPMYTCHQSMFCNRALIEKIGYFDEEFRTAMDYDFILRAAKITTPYYLHGFLVANFTFGGVTGSVQDIVKMHREIMRVKKKNGYKPVQGYYYYALLKVGVKWVLEKVFGRHIRETLVDRYRMFTGRAPKFK